MTKQCPVCQASVQANDTSCPQCGFKLLGTTEKFAPLPLDEQENARAQSGGRAKALRVLRGPQAGVSYHLTDDKLTIGRSPQCSIFLNDMTVSRAHAILEREGDCYVITDQKSFNGVWINNQNVETKALSPGDIIQIGTFCLVYEEQDENSAQ